MKYVNRKFLPSQWAIKYLCNNMAFSKVSFHVTSKKLLLLIKREGERERGGEEGERDFILHVTVTKTITKMIMTITMILTKIRNKEAKVIILTLEKEVLS